MESPSNLLLCPCCRGEAIYADMLIGKDVMWQVSCTACGLSSELDEDKSYTAERWNKRLESARLKMWVTTLGSAMPAVFVLAFLLGSLMGMNLAS